MSIIKDFGDVLLDIEVMYEKHFPEKGDSWKECDVAFLEKKLVEEYSEFLNVEGDKESYKELTDLALVSLMLLKRIKER